ncbi:suppressor of tub2 mutation [Ophidiomyces ophidiicola]|uniref:suppressor of tub2 mutation n=1 Tax=Ophidiomyces ophidiicola TaxID=1387563 RepID=UPI0020C4D50C|nr:suppressor of tub2 mutation [Ophidiomyces ophidiicola]KAI1945508.1 suppressor of tub2 mutation [Ophidiomyces ophidiicola]KAI2063289.1 suppressor of tub2 mutation [Ophidiomyces ophidiicola]
MDAKATELLAALRNSNLSLDAKTTLLTKLKSDIKQKIVPDVAISSLFECFRLSIASQHASLSSAGFSALGHLLKRLMLQEQYQAIVLQGRATYPLLLEKLGEHKERIRAQAAQIFTEFWLASPADVEHHVLQVALIGKNPRAKETSMTWLAKMTREHGLLFRNYVSSLVNCLEDADGTVRETAKSTVIEVFQYEDLSPHYGIEINNVVIRNAPPRAISDLKKQLVSHNVRKSITTSILSSLGVNISTDAEMATSFQSQRSEMLRSASSFSHRRPDESSRPLSVLSVRSHSNNDVQNMPNIDSSFDSAPKHQSDPPGKEPHLLHTTSTESLPTANPVTADGEFVEPIYVNSHREFEDMIREMLPHFEGRESEQNWLLREKSAVTLRRLTKGNAPHDYEQYYIPAIKSLLDGILKIANSLRTTLSAIGCYLLQDIARTCGPAIDPMVEILLQNLIKLTAALKKITAQHGNTTVDAVIGNVSFTSRIVQHIWAACQDKNVQPRQFAAGWIRTILARHGKHKGLIEHSGGLELIEKCIKRGLGDPNPGVREGMRGTFWAFFKVWPSRADAIMSTLELKSKALLERDPNNPNSSSGAQTSDHSRAALSYATPGRPSLKETINAQKRARLAASKSHPPRPESAQSCFSDPKPNKSSVRRPPITSSSTVRVPTGEKLFQNTSLSSAPMRPTSRPRRPELARPATADPYSSRRSAHPDSQSKPSSPSGSPQKSKPKSTATTTPRSRNVPSRPKSRLGDAPTNATRERQKPDRSAISPKTPRRGQSDANVLSTISRTRGKTISPPKTELGYTTASHNDDEFIEPPKRVISDSTGRSTPRPITPVRTPLKAGFCTPSRSQPRRNETPGSRASASPLQFDKDNAEVIRLKSPFHISNGNNESTSSHSPGVLKVYEDPRSPDSSDSVAQAGAAPTNARSPGFQTKAMPLEELPINEPTTVPNRKHNQLPDNASKLEPSPILSPANENLHRRWKKIENSERRRSLSPRSKDPVKAQDMVTRGLTRIRAGTLDVHGYRKFQTLLKYHDVILKDESKYEEILIALFDALEMPDSEKGAASSRSLDLKTQILVTIRLMLYLNREGFAAFYPRATTAIITARKHYELTNHIVSGLEETAEDIVGACDPQEVIDAILDLLETEEQSHECSRMITMGSYILSGLLRRLNQKRFYLPQPDLERLGKFANQNLRSTQPDVRRAIIEFCPELYDMVQSEDVFWPMVNTPVEDVRPLLTYYIMRRHGRTT